RQVVRITVGLIEGLRNAHGVLRREASNNVLLWRRKLDGFPFSPRLRRFALRAAVRSPYAEPQFASGGTVTAPVYGVNVLCKLVPVRIASSERIVHRHSMLEQRNVKVLRRTRCDQPNVGARSRQPLSHDLVETEAGRRHDAAQAVVG